MGLKVGETQRAARKALRDDDLRERLRGMGLAQHLVEIADKLEDLDNPLDSLAVQRLKASADIRSGLLKKILPDLKALDLSVEGSGNFGALAEILRDSKSIPIVGGAPRCTDS